MAAAEGAALLVKDMGAGLPVKEPVALLPPQRELPAAGLEVKDEEWMEM